MTRSLAELGWSPLLEEHFEAFRQQGLVPARVTREDRGAYHVYCQQGEVLAEVTGRFRHDALSRSDFPAVGDWVAASLRPEEQKAAIHALLPRKSSFSRKVAGLHTEEQVVAANADTVFLVSGVDGDCNGLRQWREPGHCAQQD